MSAALELVPPAVDSELDWHIGFACPCCKATCYYGLRRKSGRETVAHPEPACVLSRQFAAREFMVVVKQRAGAAWPL